MSAPVYSIEGMLRACRVLRALELSATRREVQRELAAIRQLRRILKTRAA